jgi:hypothetical protein
MFLLRKSYTPTPDFTTVPRKILMFFSKKWRILPDGGTKICLEGVKTQGPYGPLGWNSGEAVKPFRLPKGGVCNPSILCYDKQQGAE